MVKKLRIMKLIKACHFKQLGLKRANTRRDNDDFDQELLALRCGNFKPAVWQSVNLADHLAQVKRCIEGFDLRQQTGCQLTARGAQKSGYVVNRFVGVQLNALAARVRQRVNNVRFDL